MSPPELVSIHRVKNAALVPSSVRRAGMPRPTPEKPLIISASELKSFLRCRTRWWWQYQARLVPVERPEAFALGTMIHAIIERWYLSPVPRRTAKRMEAIARKMVRDTSIENLKSDDRELALAMCVGYAQWQHDPENDEYPDRDIGLVKCEPELEFSFPLSQDKSILVHGKIDNPFLSTTKKKTAALLEFKSASQFRQRDLELQTQLSVYLWALRRQYPKMRRYVAYFTQLRKQMPGPRVKAALFQRELVERTDDEIEQWAIDTQNAALDMIDAAIYPHPTDDCAWDCDYRNACMLRSSPEDLKHVLSTEFKIKERKR